MMLKCDGSLAFMSGNLAPQDPSSSVWSPPIILFLPLLLLVAFTIGRAIAGKKPVGFPFLIAGAVVKGMLKEKRLLGLIALGVAPDFLGSHLLGPFYDMAHTTCAYNSAYLGSHSGGRCYIHRWYDVGVASPA